MRDNQIATVMSLNVPTGLTLILYKEDNFRGQFLSINGPKKIDFSKEYQEWGGNVNSLKAKTYKDMTVTGTWVRVASVSAGDHLELDLVYGWSSTDTSDTPDTIN
jgi:hypothetical protein